MSTHPKQFLGRLAALAVLGLAAGPVLSAQGTVEAIVAPAKRTEGLERARQLLTPKELPAKTANPFYSATFNEVRLGGSGNNQEPTDTTGGSTVTPAGPKAGRDLLQAIAASLKPRYVEMGGQSLLFFGQKRVKAGNTLIITYEGTEYTLEIAAIDRINFTLRLNREEFTRTIK